jgi:hypothetical protein
MDDGSYTGKETPNQVKSVCKGRMVDCLKGSLEPLLIYPCLVT